MNTFHDPETNMLEVRFKAPPDVVYHYRADTRVDRDGNSPEAHWLILENDGDNDERTDDGDIGGDVEPTLDPEPQPEPEPEPEPEPDSQPEPEPDIPDPGLVSPAF